MTDKLIVGGLEVSVDHAKELAWEYMNQHGEWSYPAYDSYPGNGDPNSVGPQDALAAGLLNAGQNPITTQYSFLSVQSKINELLGSRHLTGTLDRAGTETLAAIAKLYGVLDGTPTPQLRLVKLAKILHLKRSGLLPLYDDNIWRCYGKLGKKRMSSVRGRSGRDFMMAWLPHIQKDLADGLDHWKAIAALAPADGPGVTPLRALDMVAWRLVEEKDPRVRRRARRRLA